MTMHQTSISIDGRPIHNRRRYVGGINGEQDFPADT